MIVREQTEDRHGRIVLPEAPIRQALIEALDRRYRDLRLPAGQRRRPIRDAGLMEYGLCEPVLVSDGVEEGCLVLIDGFKRVEWLSASGAEQVWVAVARLDEPSALAAMALANAGRRGLTELEEAWILVRLAREHGLSQVRIAEHFGRHKSWVCRRISLVLRLERAVQDDVRLGLVHASTARELSRLPRGNQVAAARAVTTHGLTTRQAGRLVSVLLTTDPEDRRAVLLDPLGNLKEPVRDSMPPPDKKLSRKANRLREQLLRIHAAASRVEEFLVSQPEGSFASRERAVLEKLAGAAFAKAIAAVEQVRAVLGEGKETSDAS